MGRGDIPAPRQPTRQQGAAPAVNLVFDAAPPPFLKEWLGDDVPPQEEPVDANEATNAPARFRKRAAASREGQGWSNSERPRRPFESHLSKKRRQREEPTETASARAHGVADDSDEERESKLAAFAKVDKKRNGKKAATKGAQKPENGTESGGPSAKKKREKSKQAATEALEDTKSANAESAAAKSTVAKESAKGGSSSNAEDRSSKREKNFDEEKPASETAEPKAAADVELPENERVSAIGSSTTQGARSNAAAAGLRTTGGGEAAFPKKQKRRSRLKNIRKDNRAPEERPAHLRPGHPAFIGVNRADFSNKLHPEKETAVGPSEDRTGEASADKGSSASGSSGENARGFGEASSGSGGGGGRGLNSRGRGRGRGRTAGSRGGGGGGGGGSGGGGERRSGGGGASAGGDGRNGSGGDATGEAAAAPAVAAALPRLGKGSKYKNLGL